MADPKMFADAIAALQRLDLRLAGLRPELLAARAELVRHETRCAGVCQDINIARDRHQVLTDEVDWLLDDRLQVADVRDLECTWIESGGADELSL